MKIKYDSVDINGHKDRLIVEDTTYFVDTVCDHLEQITNAITGGLKDFVRGGAVALDFSDLRQRGAKTSTDGISTGAASFVKTFADMIEIMSNQNAEKRYKPVVILSEGHPDFAEYKNIKTDAIIKLSRKDGWDTISPLA
jgi:ribonucleotide reductase alpha subunit